MLAPALRLCTNEALPYPPPPDEPLAALACLDLPVLPWPVLPVSGGFKPAKSLPRTSETGPAVPTWGAGSVSRSCAAGAVLSAVITV